MKRFAFAAALFVAFLSTLAHAQLVDLRANIPFEFRVGQTEMPAGEYLIHEQAPGVLILRDVTGRHTIFSPFMVGASRPVALETGQLEFTRYGDTYFLAKLWAPSSRTGMAVRKSARETELARQLGLGQPASIALARK
jgi:hypothetical protein